MSVNWTTLFFEIVNFLILVWLLTRFLYRPVLRIIEERRAAVRAEMETAEALKAQAGALKAGYEKALQEWELEQQIQRDQLQKELDEERGRKLQQLLKELEAEEKRARAAEKNRQEELQLMAQEQALNQGAAFTARLFESLAGPELETRLAELFISDFQALPSEQLEAVKVNLEAEDEPILLIQSAFGLDKKLEHRLAKTLHQSLGRQLPLRFEQAPELIAGLSVSIGYWVLHANLRDELEFFVKGTDHHGTD